MLVSGTAARRAESVSDGQAARTYTELEFSNYGSKTLGDVKYFDADEARCDCTYTPSKSPKS